MMRRVSLPALRRPSSRAPGHQRLPPLPSRCPQWASGGLPLLAGVNPGCYSPSDSPGVIGLRPVALEYSFTGDAHLQRSLREFPDPIMARPLRGRMNPETATPMSDQRPSRPQARVLVVEDEPLVAQMLTDALETYGDDVEMATNGRRALDKIEARAYDLIISDLRMSELDGV